MSNKSAIPASAIEAALPYIPHGVPTALQGDIVRAVIQAALPALRASIEADLRERLLSREAGPYDRERFTICICPKCGGRRLMDHLQRQSGGCYCYCKPNKGDGTRCEEIEAVALHALSPDEGEACKECEGRREIPTGECLEAMSGPTCMNPNCPPCQTPERIPCPDCGTGKGGGG